MRTHYSFCIVFPVASEEQSIVYVRALLKYLNLLGRKRLLCNQTRSEFTIVIRIFAVNRSLFFFRFPRIFSNQTRNFFIECKFQTMWLEWYIKPLSENRINRVASLKLLNSRKKVYNLAALHTPPPHLSNTKSYSDNECWMDDKGIAVQGHGMRSPSSKRDIFLTTHPRPHKSIFCSEMGKCDKKASPDKQSLTCRPLMRIWTPLLIR